MLNFRHNKGLAPDFAMSLGANLANSGSVFLATLLLIRALPQADFGWIGAGLAYAFVLAKVLDAGVTFTALRFGARHLEAGEGEAYLGMMYLIVSTLALATLCLVPLLFVPSFRAHSFAADGPLFWAATIGTAWSIALQGALRSDLQARGHYGLLLVNALLTAGFRLVIVLGLWMALLPSSRLFAYLGLYLLPVVLASVFCLPLIKRSLGGFLQRRAEFRPMLRKLFSYAPWVWMSGTLFVLTLRGPIFALQQLGQTEQVAMLAAALSFVSLVALANDAARSVLLPRTVRFQTPEEFKAYLDRVGHLAPRVFLFMLPILLVAAWAIKGLLPVTYLPTTIYAFFALAVSLLATVLLGSVTNLIHALGKPFPEALVNLLRAISVAGGCYLLARFADCGAAGLALFAGVGVVAFELVFAIYVLSQIGNCQVNEQRANEQN